MTKVVVKEASKVEDLERSINLAIDAIAKDGWKFKDIKYQTMVYGSVFSRYYSAIIIFER